jgi:hypothetical protein
MQPSARALQAVRSEVERLVDASPAARTLAPAERQRFVDDLTKVSAFMVPSEALEDDVPAAPPLVPNNQPPPPPPEEQLRRRLAEKPGQVGADFQAGAIKAGVEEFGALVTKVDFPNFVSGLVQGVFRAIIDASIQQMQAFGELLQATAKTVDEFAQDNITDGMARDHIARTYPSAVQVDTSANGPARLKPVEGNDTDIGKAFGLSGVDISDSDGEQQLVAKVKLRLAEDRQKLLSTMVLMGINRIVVTNGHINAKVVFDMRASDVAKRRAKAEMHDRVHDTSAAFAMGGIALGPIAAMAGGFTSHDHVAEVSSAVDDSSESKAQVRAQLTGEVRMAFKSETFPLEKFADMMGLTPPKQPQPAAPAQAAAPRRIAPPPAPAPAAAAAPPPRPASPPPSSQPALTNR